MNFNLRLLLVASTVLIAGGQASAQVVTECNEDQWKPALAELLFVNKLPEYDLLFVGTHNPYAAANDVELIVLADVGSEEQDCFVFHAGDTGTISAVSSDIVVVESQRETEDLYVFVTHRPYAFADPDAIYLPDHQWETTGLHFDYRLTQDGDFEFRSFESINIME